ncbi:MAG: alpha/beta fold hydrolase [Betaproteobacteria bacterium]|nr:alpha/beta fold hydrolase [Betaproteobacteria bacterium]
MWSSIYPPMNWDAYKAQWPNALHSQFVSTPGLRWHVQIMGQGPVMLMLHGTGASTHTWRRMLPLLASRFTLVCPDLPGHAFTSPHASLNLSLPNVSGFLDQLLVTLKLKPSVVVGHSAGAALGAHWVIHHSHAIANTALVALNPAWLALPGLAYWLFPPAAKLMALNPATGFLAAKFLASPEQAERLIASTGSRLSPQDLSYYAALLASSTHINGVLSMMSSWNVQTLEGRLPELVGPILMCIGRQDQTVSPAQAQKAVKMMPHAQTRFFEGLGHLAHEEDPLQTCEVMLKWQGLNQAN